MMTVYRTAHELAQDLEKQGTTHFHIAARLNQAGFTLPTGSRFITSDIPTLLKVTPAVEKIDSQIKEAFSKVLTEE